MPGESVQIEVQVGKPARSIVMDALQLQPADGRTNSQGS